MSPTFKSLILTTTLLGNASLCAAQLTPQSTTQSPPAGAAATAIHAEHPQERRLSEKIVRENVALARNAYADIHPGYTRFTDVATLDAAWQAILERNQREAGLSVGDFYLEISAVLAQIRCDHTKAELPRDLAKARDTDAAYLPLSWTIVDERALIRSAPEGSPVRAGDEILSIDGRSIDELRTALHPYLPVDGYNDHVRDTEMGASGEFKGGAVDHFGALLWDVPATATLDLESPDGEQWTIQLDRVGFKAWSALNANAGRRNFKDAVSLTRIGDNGAVLRVDTFVNYREPVDVDTIYGPVFEALKSEGRDHLILDLRRNGGGSTEASQGLFSYLISEKRRMKTADIMKTIDHDAYVDYISTWEQRAINPPRFAFRKTDQGEYRLRGMFSDETDRIEPASSRFDGKLTILTSRNNSSGSTNLIATLRAARDVTLIGEKTGGNPAGPTAGTIFFLTLPESNIRLRVPVFRFENNSGPVEDGIGLEPDIAAPDTIDSLREGRDPALEAAIALISDQDD
ncbi:S41 family peptidase [Algimonas porphyrae]|uniref:Tail specific protease domain-containing protein n=1 Tax=Algimonas porphyrae TaxID=1128113 RepID=A0ABQ5V4L1_9PROT|nr:S41 family peptidase [Algimonas porphyrae]GLQ22002.1 hypothetical protein GCM10007854_29570 [Algimonas porphyrae]